MFDGALGSDPGLPHNPQPIRHPERLASSITATKPRRRCFLPRQCGIAAILFITMAVVAFWAADVATAILLNEAVLAAIGIAP
ncbi:MAG: hypothetical protein AB7H90_01010 [Alphaproteobacteria bacterium]